MNKIIFSIIMLYQAIRLNSYIIILLKTKKKMKEAEILFFHTIHYDIIKFSFF